MSEEKNYFTKCDKLQDALRESLPQEEYITAINNITDADKAIIDFAFNFGNTQNAETYNDMTEKVRESINAINRYAEKAGWEHILPAPSKDDRELILFCREYKHDAVVHMIDHMEELDLDECD